VRLIDVCRVVRLVVVRVVGGKTRVEVEATEEEREAEWRGARGATLEEYERCNMLLMFTYSYICNWM